MTSEQFKAWRKHMGFSQTEAGASLGLSKSTIEMYDSGLRKADKTPIDIPKAVELACAAIALGIRAYEGPQ